MTADHRVQNARERLRHLSVFGSWRRLPAEGHAARRGHRGATAVAIGTEVKVDEPARGVLRLHLAGGNRRNVLGRRTIEGIREALASLGHDSRVIVITADDPDFCAGYDLLEADRDGPEALIAAEANLDALLGVRLPVIAALHGNVIGGGLELAACADIRFASPTTKLAIPAGHLGVVYSRSGASLLVRSFGESMARSMLLGGVALSCEEARAMGFISRITSGDVTGDALELAASIASWPRIATSGNRQLLDAVTGRTAADVEALRAIAFAEDGALVANIRDFVAKHDGHSDRDAGVETLGARMWSIARRIRSRSSGEGSAARDRHGWRQETTTTESAV